MAQECKINFTLKTSIIHHINRIKEKKHSIISIDVEKKIDKKTQHYCLMNTRKITLI